MTVTRREFIGQILAVTLSGKQLPAVSTRPSCSFAAPRDQLARAGALISPSTKFSGDIYLPTNRLKTYAQELKDSFSQVNIQLALGKNYLWSTRTLSVTFLGNVDSQFQQKIRAAISDWSPHAGIEFHLVPNLPADIRVELVADGQNWSQYGTNAKKIPPDQATVHFGTINQYSGGDDIYRVAVHEFGHVLGALHEHQSPAASGIDWNTAVVNDYYHGIGWTDEMIQANIYATFPPDAAYCTRLDPMSIMIYDFPANFTTNQMAVKPNFVLSDLDKSGMKTLYDQARSKKK